VSRLHSLARELPAALALAPARLTTMMRCGYPPPHSAAVNASMTAGVIDFPSVHQLQRALREPPQLESPTTGDARPCAARDDESARIIRLT
jgi:hypothetical protein